jgi:hypothetical protein
LAAHFLPFSQQKLQSEWTEAKAMKIVSHILGLSIACIAMPALAKPAYVASTVNLRAAPGTGSEIVAKIPGGSLVDAGACDEGWCEISWQDKKGFAIQTALNMSGRLPQPRAAAGPAYRQGPQAPQVVEGPEVIDGPVYYDRPPPVVYYGGPYYRPYWGWRRYWW